MQTITSRIFCTRKNVTLKEKREGNFSLIYLLRGMCSLLRSFVAARRKSKGDGRGRGGGDARDLPLNPIVSNRACILPLVSRPSSEFRHDRNCPTLMSERKEEYQFSLITDRRYTFITWLVRREVRSNREESPRNPHTRELFRDREAALAAMMGVSGE